MQPLPFLDALRLWDGLGSVSFVYYEFATAAAPLLVAALWQGVLVATALAVCVRLAPRISAAQRFVIWWAGFGVLVVLPFLPALARLAGSVAKSSASAGAGSAGFAPWLAFDLRWTLILAAIWLIASVARIGDLVIHSLTLWKLWRTAVPAALAEESIHPAKFAISRRCEICTTRSLDRPSVIGFFRPRILIPDWLLPRLTPAELEQIVLHEAEHLRRRDDWTNLLQKFCLVLFPLNPALWWIERKLCREREMACDEGVVRMTHAPRAYAACLTSLAERRIQRRAEALSLGAWQRRPDLAQRVHSILRRPSRALSPFASRALFSVLGCGLVAASIELARCPQLVAFVPEQKANSADVASIPNRDAHRLLRSGYAVVPARLTQERRFFAVPANAVLRTNKQSSRTKAQPSGRHFEDGLKPVPLAREAPTTHRRLFRTTANQSVTDAAGMQFVVLSTWQEIETPATNSQPIADYDAPQPAGQREGASPQGVVNQTSTKNQPSVPSQVPDAQQQPGKKDATRITIMQLIFRVNPGSPAAASIPDGWLVLQL